MTDERLRAIAQRLADQQLQDFDFLSLAENQDELDLTDDELEDVYQLVVHARAVLPEDT